MPHPGSHIVDLLIREVAGAFAFSITSNPTLQARTTIVDQPRRRVCTGQRAGRRQPMLAALKDIDVVFHEAAYGGYMPEMAKYVLVNSFGTAQMLELIRDHNLPIRKVLVASSQAVYSEGAALCPTRKAMSCHTSVPSTNSAAASSPCTVPSATKSQLPFPHPNPRPVVARPFTRSPKSIRSRLVLLWGGQDLHPHCRNKAIPAPTARASHSSTRTPGSSRSSARACSTISRPFSMKTATRLATSVCSNTSRR